MTNTALPHWQEAYMNDSKLINQINYVVKPCFIELSCNIPFKYKEEILWYNGKVLL